MPTGYTPLEAPMSTTSTPPGPRDDAADALALARDAAATVRGLYMDDTVGAQHATAMALSSIALSLASRPSTAQVTPVTPVAAVYDPATALTGDVAVGRDEDGGDVVLVYVPGSDPDMLPWRELSLVDGATRWLDTATVAGNGPLTLAYRRPGGRA